MSIKKRGLVQRPCSHETLMHGAESHPQDFTGQRYPFVWTMPPARFELFAAHWAQAARRHPTANAIRQPSMPTLPMPGYRHQAKPPDHQEVIEETDYGPGCYRRCRQALAPMGSWLGLYTSIAKRRSFPPGPPHPTARWRLRGLPQFTEASSEVTTHYLSSKCATASAD